jgi:transcriptional regulator with XRE-family HTH domain
VPKSDSPAPVPPAPHRLLLAENLRALRAERRISQEDLANQLGLSRTYMSAIERGRKAPTIDVLARLAAGLNVPIWRLMFDEGKVGRSQS